MSSGEWSDDADNWSRAFGYSQPAEVVVAHSWYWRSAHFTREEAYFFEFQWHDDLFTQLIEKNGMRRAEPLESTSDGKDSVVVTSAESSRPEYCFEAPAWFSPAASSRYEIWRSETGRSWLFRDPITKEMFLYACQL